MVYFVHRISSPDYAVGVGEKRVDEISLIGPFDTNDEAADWGATFCCPGGPGDPRWNVVNLGHPGSSTQFVISIEPPAGAFEKGAYRALNEI